jgi:GDP-L-galactose phosphorylase
MRPPHRKFCQEGTASRNPHVVLINVSPIEYGHVLLVPRILDSLPQQISPQTLQLALEMTAESDNPYFRCGYNSLGAYATINHLHFQVRRRASARVSE